MERTKATFEEIETIVMELQRKIAARLLNKGLGVFASNHEILGILTEEFHELVDAVKSDVSLEVRHELFDIAIGAMFGIVSIDINKREKV